MSRGKYLSLEEALKGGSNGTTLDQFCKEHPSEGDESQFDKLFEKMARGKNEENEKKR